MGSKKRQLTSTSPPSSPCLVRICTEQIPKMSSSKHSNASILTVEKSLTEMNSNVSRWPWVNVSPKKRSMQLSMNRMSTMPVTSITSSSPDWSSTVLERRNDELKTYCGVYEELMNDSWTLCLTFCKPVDIVDCLRDITVTISNHLLLFHHYLGLIFSDEVFYIYKSASTETEDNRKVNEPF